MKICNSRLGLWVWRDMICIWTTMKTRTPDLLGMSYACANMVHSPGYADDLRQYTSLNNFFSKKERQGWKVAFIALPKTLLLNCFRLNDELILIKVENSVCEKRILFAGCPHLANTCQSSRPDDEIIAYIRESGVIYCGIHTKSSLWGNYKENDLKGIFVTC